MSFLPLAGIRVLDVTGSLAGPYCTEILSALGADVVKVERPAGGDDTRTWGPPFWNGEGVLFLSANAGKRSLALSLSEPSGREALLRLADRADVFVQSLRPGLAERLGLGADDLRARNAGLVYCSVGAFGREGPLSGQAGYDPLMQAFTGMLSVTGESEGPGVRVGTSLIDFATGMWAALGVVAALHERSGTGRGRTVDLALFETAVALMAYHLTGFLGTGALPGRHGTAFPLIAPYQVFATRDGEIMIAAANDRLFASLCEAIGEPGLPDDPRFGTNPGRVEHRDALAERVAERLRSEPTAVWLERLERLGVPVAPVQDVAALAAHEQLRATGLLQTLPHTGGELPAVALPLSVDGERILHRSAPPAVGEHSAEVLAEVGYSSGEIAALATAGVVGLPGGATA